MTDHQLGSISLPPTLDLEELLAYWGRDPESTSESVDGRTITWTLSIGSWPCLLAASLEPDRARLELRVLGPPPGADRPGSPDPPTLAEAATLARRLLGLHLDPGPFVARLLAGADPLAPHVARRPGLTIPQTPTVFDGVIWVIAGQQVSLPVAFSIRRRLSRALGRPVEHDGRERFVPPTPAAIAAVDEDFLHSHGLTRRKAEYLRDLARAELEGRLDLEGLRQRPADAVSRELLAQRGLGPWSVDYLRMRSLGHGDCVPVGDVALERALQRLHRLPERPRSQAAADLLARYAPHRSLATFHTWGSLRDPVAGDGERRGQIQ